MTLIEKIKEIIWEPEVWFKWTWIVEKIIDWVGAIVAFKWKTWMIHISKLSYKRVAKVEDILNIWDKVDFEIVEIDLASWIKRIRRTKKAKRRRTSKKYARRERKNWKIIFL